MNIEIANRLLELRKKNNLSQEELAEKLGISRQAVSKWERAEASPDTDNLIALAKLYKVSLDEMLMIKEEPESVSEQLEEKDADTETEAATQCESKQCESEPYNGREYCLEGIQKIKIYTASRDVRIYQAAGKKLSVEEYLGKNTEAIQVNVQDGTLFMREREKRGMNFPFFIGWQNTGTEIFIPKDFGGLLEVETASGDIELNGSWELKEMMLKAVSGDLTVGMVKAEKIQLDVVSGDIQFAGGGSRSFIRTISGDVEVACLGGEFHVETGSGDVDMHFREITGPVNVKSTSGDVDIKMAANSSCLLMAEAVSGDVSSNLHKAQIVRRSDNYVEAVIGDNAEADIMPRVVVQAISGDIDIIG